MEFLSCCWASMHEREGKIYHMGRMIIDPCILLLNMRTACTTTYLHLRARGVWNWQLLAIDCRGTAGRYWRSPARYCGRGSGDRVIYSCQPASSSMASRGENVIESSLLQCGAALCSLNWSRDRTISTGRTPEKHSAAWITTEKCVWLNRSLIHMILDGYRRQPSRGMAKPLFIIWQLPALHRMNC